MFKDNKEDISKAKIEYSLISIFSKKLRVGIVGAGRGGFIKAKHFIEQGCYVEILAERFHNNFSNINCDNCKIDKREYNKEFIRDKHLIIIAIDNEEKCNEIRRDCDEEFKIYIDSTSFKQGMGSIPAQIDLNSAVIGINTRGGNPKGAIVLKNKVKDVLEKYDDYISFTTLVRNFAKDKVYKKEIIDFIGCEDFIFIFEKGYGEKVLEMFF